MQACLRERLWLYFYCATAPTVSESAKQICEMAALRVAWHKSVDALGKDNYAWREK